MTALDKAGLVALADRVEALTDESQLVRLLEDAASRDLLWANGYDGWVHFLELANVKAWESAAMSLLREGWGDWSIGRDSVHRFEAAIWAIRSRYISSGGDSTCHQGYHQTSAALALTAAALRAIAAGQP